MGTENYRRIPSWLRRPVGERVGRGAPLRAIRDGEIHTVCEEARCPNRGVCWGVERTATFLLLGPGCSRDCGFCSVRNRPTDVDAGEPTRVANAAAALGLGYVVLTSTTRDDLSDGGARHFAAVVAAVKKALPAAAVEVLVPDFLGSHAAVEEVAAAGINVFGHNVETVPRLYPRARAQADYRRSLDILQYAGSLGMVTKSALLVGLGETDAEIMKVLEDLAENDVAIVAIGQYLRPGPEQLPVIRYWTPAAFENWDTRARALGFRGVACGPFVRSSYQAGTLYKTLSSDRRS